MKHDVRLLKVCLSLLLCCWLAIQFTDMPLAEAAPTQITMSIEQWNQFKNQTNLLEAKLNLVDEKLKQQKNTSTELLTQLNEAKKQLNLTQEALTNSKRSLVSAEESLKRSEELYKTLTEQMELERRKAKIIKCQRNVYAGCAVFVIAYAVAK